jgi:hypothetical protein
MAKSPITKDGPNKGWTHQEGDEYLVTGKDKEGKTVRLQYKDWQTAQAIRIWQGTKWLVRGGKKYVILRVTN